MSDPPVLSDDCILWVSGDHYAYSVKKNDNTAILDIKRNRDRGTDEKIYNLNGQLMKQPGKGIFIINGKKVMVK